MTPYYFVLLFCMTVSADFNKLGCFPKNKVIDGLTSKGEYLYQTSGYCEDQCSGSKYAALIDGSTCYCGSTYIDPSDETDESNCDTICQGFGSDYCGGENYFLIYQDPSVDASSASAATTSLSSSPATLSSSSSLLSSSSSSSSLKSKSKTSSSTSSEEPSSTAEETSSFVSSVEASSTQADQSSITEVSTVTGSSGSKETTVTETKGPSSTASGSATSDSSDSDGKTSKHSEKKGLSGGAIAGIVVGTIAGVALLAAIAILLFWYKRRHSDDDDDEDDINDMKGFSNVTPTSNYNIKSNAFVTNAAPIQHAKQQSFNTNSFKSNNDDYFMFDDPNSQLPYPTEDFGRRRLSDGSLPDMVTKGSLKVVNN